MLFKKGRIKFPDIKKEQISFCSLIYICHSFLIGVLPSQSTFFYGFNIKNEVVITIIFGVFFISFEVDFHRFSQGMRDVIH